MEPGNTYPDNVTFMRRLYVIHLQFNTAAGRLQYKFIYDIIENTLLPELTET